MVLDHLDPRALARALLGPGPGRRSGGPPPASVRGYRARRATRQARMLARGRLRAVAVDGKTARRARRADGTRVHLLGAAEHSGHLLDHLEAGDGHNETSYFTELLNRGPQGGTFRNTPEPGRERSAPARFHDTGDAYHLIGRYLGALARQATNR